MIRRVAKWFKRRKRKAARYDKQKNWMIRRRMRRQRRSGKR